MVVVGLVAMVCAGAGLRCRAQSQDAKELIEAVSLKSNLEGSDIQPWHVRIHYQTTSLVDSQSYQGTIEEWWQSDKRLRAEFVVNGKMRRYDVTDHGTYASGDLKSLPYVVGGILSDMLWPMPPTTVLAKLGFEETQKKLSGTETREVHIASLPGDSHQMIESLRHKRLWFIAKTDPILRIEVDEFAAMEFVRNDLLSFQNRFIAGEYLVGKAGKIIQRTSIEKLETMPNPSEATFQVPADAVKEESTSIIAISGYMSEPILFAKVTPVYPMQAKMSGISGTVVLHGVITPEGNVADLKPADGPVALFRSAMDAVKQWRYIPQSMNGKPISTKAEFHIVYALSR